MSCILSFDVLQELRATLENVPIARVHVGYQLFSTESNAVWTPMGAIAPPDSQQSSKPVGGYSCAVEYSALSAAGASQAQVVLSPSASAAAAVHRYSSGFFQLTSIDAQSGRVRGTCNFKGDFNSFISVSKNICTCVLYVQYKLH